MDISGGVLGAIVLAIIVAAFARWRGWGVALPLLGAGVIIGFLPFGPTAPENAGEVFLLILAPLVFGEALSASFIDIRRFRRPILALAIGLVVVSSAAVGAVAQAVVPALPLSLAFALGAILSPTDAVAVASVAKRAALPRSIVTILEGESLVNDGTGLTLLRVALAAAAAGAFSAGEVLLVLAQSVLGGIVVGAAVGFALVWVMRHTRDDLIVNCLILIVPFPVYLIAEEIGGSGILAVVAAALIIANQMLSDRRFRGRMASVAVWRQITFILSAFAFFLVGMEIPTTLEALSGEDRARLPLLVISVLVTLFLARALFVLAMVLLTRRSSGERLRLREAVVLAWAGARGPVSGLAAFSLPVAVGGIGLLPERNLLLATTFLVIAATLLLAPTLGPVAKLVRLTRDADEGHTRDLQAALAARGLEALDRAVEQGYLDHAPYEHEAEHAVRDRLIASLHPDAAADPAAPEGLLASQVWQLERAVIIAQQEELLRLRDEEGMPDALVRPVMHELDLQLAALNTRKPQS